MEQSVQVRSALEHAAAGSNHIADVVRLILGDKRPKVSDRLGKGKVLF